MAKAPAAKAAKAPAAKARGVRQWECLITCVERVGPEVLGRDGKFHTGATRYMKEGRRFKMPASWKPTKPNAGYLPHFREITPELIAAEEEAAAEEQLEQELAGAEGGMGGEDSGDRGRGGHVLGQAREGEGETTSGID